MVVFGILFIADAAVASTPNEFSTLSGLDAKVFLNEKRMNTWGALGRFSASIRLLDHTDLSSSGFHRARTR